MPGAGGALSSGQRRDMMKLVIGTSGWNYPHWKGRFYPEDIKKKEWFGYYAGQFNTVEVNNTFYRWPSEQMLEGWRQHASKGFVYTLKAPRTITHMKKLKDVEGYVSDFYELSAKLGNRLGCHLFQLPGNIKLNDNNRQKLLRFLACLDTRTDNAIEFRDPSWWSEEVFAMLRKHKVAFVNVVGGGMPEQFVVTAGFIYCRFHGDDHTERFSRQKLKSYAREIKKSGVKKAYVYFNNDGYAHAPRNAREMQEELGAL